MIDPEGRNGDRSRRLTETTLERDEDLTENHMREDRICFE
jgi:hypothetical protein